MKQPLIVIKSTNKVNDKLQNANNVRTEFGGKKWGRFKCGLNVYIGDEAASCATSEDSVLGAGSRSK